MRRRPPDVTCSAPACDNQPRRLCLLVPRGLNDGQILVWALSKLTETEAREVAYALGLHGRRGREPL